MDDNKIIELYFARDERAIEETRTSYGRLIYSVAYNILDSAPDSEECENDTYLRTWDSIPPTRPSILSAYLSRISRNLALNRLRDEKREAFSYHFRGYFTEDKDYYGNDRGNEGCRFSFISLSEQVDRYHRGY